MNNVLQHDTFVESHKEQKALASTCHAVVLKVSNRMPSIRPKRHSNNKNNRSNAETGNTYCVACGTVVGCACTRPETDQPSERVEMEHLSGDL